LKNILIFLQFGSILDNKFKNVSNLILYSLIYYCIKLVWFPMCCEMTEIVGAGEKTELLPVVTTSWLSVKRREQDKTGLLTTQSVTLLLFSLM
jgi:hypothetical protein